MSWGCFLVGRRVGAEPCCVMSQSWWAMCGSWLVNGWLMAVLLEAVQSACHWMIGIHNTHLPSLLGCYLDCLKHLKTLVATEATAGDVHWLVASCFHHGVSELSQRIYLQIHQHTSARCWECSLSSNQSIKTNAAKRTLIALLRSNQVNRINQPSLISHQPSATINHQP